MCQNFPHPAEKSAASRYSRATIKEKDRQTTKQTSALQHVKITARSTEKPPTTQKQKLAFVRRVSVPRVRPGSGRDRPNVRHEERQHARGAQDEREGKRSLCHGKGIPRAALAQGGIRRRPGSQRFPASRKQECADEPAGIESSPSVATALGVIAIFLFTFPVPFLVGLFGSAEAGITGKSSSPLHATSSSLQARRWLDRDSATRLHATRAHARRLRTLEIRRNPIFIIYHMIYHVPPILPLSRSLSLINHLEGSWPPLNRVSLSQARRLCAESGYCIIPVCSVRG